MKNLAEKIYEGFFGNITPFDNTPVPVEYYSLRKDYNGTGEWDVYKVSYVAKRLRTIISKDAAAFGIDRLSDLILKIDPNPGSKDSMAEYRLKQYRNDKGEDKVFKVYTSGAIKKIIAKLCEDPSNKDIIKGMYSSLSFATINVQMAFGIAALKANDIIPKNFRYADLNKNDFEIAEVGIYLEAALLCMDYNKAYDLPLSARYLSAKFTNEQSKYDIAIQKLDKLKADITTLRDNKYPFDAIVEKTMNDIDSRHRVIAKLASKF